jgi:hypothetical protein
MAERFKIVFHVEDSEKRQVVPPQQTWIEFEAKEVLAIDVVEATRERLRQIEDGRSGEFAETILASAKHRDELLHTAGVIIAKLIGLKLREWARDLLVKKEQA